jgi:hypothetical protein
MKSNLDAKTGLVKIKKKKKSVNIPNFNCKHIIYNKINIFKIIIKSITNLKPFIKTIIFVKYILKLYSFKINYENMRLLNTVTSPIVD